MDRARTPESVLSEIAAIPTLERGTLCPMRRGGGGQYYNLQFWRDGANRCEYVRKADVAAVQEAVENWRRYQALTEEYAEALEGRTRQARKAVQTDRQKGGSTNRRCRRPAGR
jgi:Arc/MetJ-type ribon-helix-helix transcriptional regulator